MKMLHLGHIYIFCGAQKLDTSEGRSEIPGEYWNVVLEKDGENQLDGSCEKWNDTKSHGGEEYYTECPRRNVPDFGRLFLMLKYTDITQNTYIQSWTVTEIMAREVWNFDSCYTLIDYQIHIKTGSNMWFL